MKPKPLLRRLAAVTAMALVALTLLACTSLELGARPASSIQAVTIAADVKFIEANGLRFAYLEEGTGPLILLLHGYPETARSWAGVQHRLAAAGYRVVAPYSRGYAPSAVPADGSYAVASLGQDLIALIAAFGEQSAIVVGHDWGASAAYAVATKQPGKIKQLVAIAVPHPLGLAGDRSFFWEAPHFVYYQLPWATRLFWSHDFAHVDRLYKSWSPTYTPPPEVMADVKATLRAPGAVEAALGYYWALAQGGGLDRRLAQAPITVPSLVIAGQLDGVFSLARYEKAEPAFTGPHRLVVLDGVGHFPPLEAPERTVDAILAFLTSQR